MYPTTTLLDEALKQREYKEKRKARIERLKRRAKWNNRFTFKGVINLLKDALNVGTDQPVTQKQLLYSAPFIDEKLSEYFLRTYKG